MNQQPRFIRLRTLCAAALLSALAGCTTLAPADFTGTTPEMRPEAFFAGATSSTGVLQDSGGAPMRRLHVEGHGQLLADGQFRLDQTITFDHDAPTTRTWLLQRLDAHHYSASLTDAAGPVQAEAYGNLMHLHYVMRKPFGGRMEQWLYLQPDGRTAVNEATIRVFGVVAARLSERITRTGP